MDKKIESIILSLTNSQKITKRELIQSLWSGYGQLNRVELEKKSVIVKHIKYPNHQSHPQTLKASDISHQRKVKSYEVEINWYKNHNEKILNSYFPEYIASGEINDEKYLILEDLQNKGFKTKTTIQWDQVKLCLKWLAYFHAKNLGLSTRDLWEIGTYWHLDTRPDELLLLQDEDLKKAAPLVDKRLNSSKFQTLVHGDAKLANFMFNDNNVSAVDFQYIGGGVGIKDVAYFLSSHYDENELFLKEEVCLNYYFQELNNALVLFKPNIDGTALEKDWRELYPYAWCDFYRFLKGWAPNHWKINSYSQEMKRKVLKCI